MLTLFTANEEPVSLNLNTLLLSEQVYQYLRKEMASGNILPGSNINIANIAAQLGISKTPLRDALIHLEVEGFVTILPRKGVVVNKMSVEDVRQAYDAIGIVESAIVQANGDRMTALHIKQLRDLNELMIADIKRDDYSRYFETNLEFHDVYLQLSDNQLLKKFIMPIKQRLYDFPRQGYIREWELRNCKEHEIFISYLENGDYSRAGKYLKDVHWSFDVQEGYIREFHK